MNKTLAKILMNIIWWTPGVLHIKMALIENNKDIHNAWCERYGNQ